MQPINIAIVRGDSLKKQETQVFEQFDKEKFRKEHSIITFEEYRQRREGKGRIVTPYGKHEEIIAV